MGRAGHEHPLKALTSFGDPVELSGHDARNLADVLVRMAQAIDE